MMSRLIGSRLSLGAIVAMLCAGVIALGLGPRCGPRRDQRFPCEECGCGCSSAVECWTNCCCHTPQQRARWALLHGVAIPRFDRQTLAAAEAIVAGAGGDEAFAEMAPCCRASLLKDDQPAPGNDHASCKQRPKVSAAAAMVLGLTPTPVSFLPAPVPCETMASVTERPDPLADLEPSVPPPRA